MEENPLPAPLHIDEAGGFHIAYKSERRVTPRVSTCPSLTFLLRGLLKGRASRRSHSPMRRSLCAFPASGAKKVAMLKGACSSNPFPHKYGRRHPQIASVVSASSSTSATVGTFAPAVPRAANSWGRGLGYQAPSSISTPLPNLRRGSAMCHPSARRKRAVHLPFFFP